MLKAWVSAFFLSILVLVPISATAAFFPQQAKLQYVDNHGIPVNMNFNRQDKQYRIDVSLNLILYHFNFVSTGTVSENILTPISYMDTRQGKPYAHAVFSKQAVQFGKNGADAQQVQVDGPVYDMFALGWQLGINNGQLAKNTYLTNGKKIYPLKNISFIGQKQLSINNELINVSQFRLYRGDDVVEYAFAPSLNGIPVRISYMDNGKIYTLHLKSGLIDGKAIKTL
jgi:hypothetical protein